MSSIWAAAFGLSHMQLYTSTSSHGLIKKKKKKFNNK